jgi:NADPH2:quinone reductase
MKRQPSFISTQLQRAFGESPTYLNYAAWDYRKTDFVEEIHHLTGEGVDIVFDGIGEANVWRSFQALKPGGRVIVYGFTSFLQKGQLAGGLRYRFRGILRPAWYALRAFLSPRRRRILPYSIQYLKRRKPQTGMVP